MDKLNDYWLALDRLKRNEPIRVPIGTKISNDAVSLEAGRGKGSIKNGRAAFKEIIRAICNAKPAENEIKDMGDMSAAKKDADAYRKLYFESLEREVALVYENYQLHERLKKFQK